MSRRKYNTNDNINYRRLSTNDFECDHSVDNDQLDGHMKQSTNIPERKSSWKAVLFIIFFLIAGAACLICSVLIAVGYIGEKYDDRAWPLLILGTLMFIPGGYYSYILGSILLKREGFSLDDVPTL